MKIHKWINRTKKKRVQKQTHTCVYENDFQQCFNDNLVSGKRRVFSINGAGTIWTLYRQESKP